MMAWKRAAAAALLLGAIFLAVPAAPARAVTYLTEKQALALAFAEGTQVGRKTLQLTEEQREHYTLRLGVRPAADLTQEVFVGTREGEVAGYAFILTEQSRYRPITFLVAVAPDGRVRRVDVMVYREPRGSEVRRRRFLEQYEGAGESLSLGREILSVSGATVSAQVVTFGVNKALFLVEEFFLHPASGEDAASPGSKDNGQEPGGEVHR